MLIAGVYEPAQGKVNGGSQIAAAAFVPAADGRANHFSEIVC